MLVRAARYLQVPPWELAEQPVAWQNMALVAEAAEGEAESEEAKRARNRQRSRRRGRRR